MRKFYSLFFLKTILVTLGLVICFTKLKAQTDFTIGTGTAGNTTTSYPCPFGDWWEGQRQQYLYLASELNTAGMSAGTINVVKFTVTALTTSTGTHPQVEQFTIKIGTTSTASLSATAWENVSATVYGPFNYLPVLGVNSFTFTTPFFWNGTDNIVVEICSGDPNNASDIYYTNNSVVTWTTGLPFNGSRVYAADNGGNLCGITLGTNGSATTTATNRPNIIFNWTPATPCSGIPSGGSAISSVANVCAGQNFNLNLSGATIASGLTYQWQSSPDNTNWTSIPGATGFSYTTSQTATTYYRAIVTCTNSSASGNSASVQVVLIGGVPTPSITASPSDTVCQGTVVTLSTASCTGCAYSWSTGSTSNNITVNASSIYTVTVTNACGTGNASKEIVYRPSPSLSINGTNSICSGSSTNLQANGADTYTWSPATGLNTTTGPTVIATPTATTTYTVTGNIGNCSQSMQVTIAVNSIPSTPAITASGTTSFCQGGNVMLTSNAATGNQWYKDGVAINGAINTTYLATAGGSYTVRSSVNGCTSNASATTVVTVNSIPPQPTITQSGNILQSSAPSGNQWFLNGVLITGATGNTYSTTSGGLYSVQVTLNGCVSPMSAAFSYAVTGINSPVLDSKIKIAPNPVRDKLFIKYNGNAARFTILLINSNGTVLSKGSFTTNYDIDVGRYSAGVYIVRIINDKNGETTQRLIVKQ